MNKLIKRVLNYRLDVLIPKSIYCSQLNEGHVLLADGVAYYADWLAKSQGKKAVIWSLVRATLSGPRTRLVDQKPKELMIGRSDTILKM